tara:strand:+ start:2273 stop:2596 length:324 start_codon:yes stop_codon:yes gene_type:complete
MNIPTSFKVFASTITVAFEDTRLSNESVLGECSFTDNKIALCKEYKGEPLTPSCVLDTFYHEKIHIILDAMGEHELSKKEKFVEVFARLLRQSDETAEFDIDIKSND